VATVLRVHGDTADIDCCPEPVPLEWISEPSRFQTPGRGGSKPIGAAPRVSMTCRIDAAVLDAAKAVAGPRGLSSWVNGAIQERLEREG